ncbi:hypothetical protein [Streptomyces goshikiensis]
MMNSQKVMNAPDFKGGRREHPRSVQNLLWELELALIVWHFTCWE